MPSTGPQSWAPSLRPSPLFKSLIASGSSEPNVWKVPILETAVEPTTEIARSDDDKFETVSFLPVVFATDHVGSIDKDSDGSEWEFCHFQEIQEPIQHRDDKDQVWQNEIESMQRRGQIRASAGFAKARGKGEFGGIVRGFRDVPGDLEKRSSVVRGKNGGRRRARGRGIVVDVTSPGCDVSFEGKEDGEPEAASTGPPASEAADLVSELAEFPAESADVASVDVAAVDRTPSHASNTSRSQHSRWADYSDEDIASAEDLATVLVVRAEELTPEQIVEQALPVSGRKGRSRRRRRGGGITNVSQRQ